MLCFPHLIKMSNEITLSLPATILEELHCFICKGYLSCSPVLLLPNGNYICGRCAPLNTDTPTHRLIPLETFLSSMPFPCIFKKYGCRELLSFGKTTDHEYQCVYKPLGCPTMTSTTCPWEGTVIQLFQHFEEDHPDYIKETIEFRLELTKDSQGFLITPIPFIIKYFYNAEKRVLEYDGRYCGTSQRDHEVSCKLQLINGTDSECSINLKINACLSYDESFGGVQNGNLLDINKFIEILGDPESIIIAVNVKMPELNCIPATIALIDKLKCNQCCNFLVPPLYDLDGRVICGDCFTTNPTCKPCEDPNLLKLVNEATYPCRWRECNFVGKSNIFKMHMVTWKFRMYCCVYSDCPLTFFFGAAADHLKTHTLNKRNKVYMPNKIAYQTSFEKDYKRKDILSIINGKLIFFQHKMVSINSKRLHEISIHRTRDNPNEISGIITFEHVHCKLTKDIEIPKSKFYVQVGRNKLFPCFRDTDKLTVTVAVIF